MVWVDMVRDTGAARMEASSRSGASLEVDLVDDAKADERGEAERDGDGEEVNIDGQPEAGVRLRGAN
jgi:hypothetical protein